MTCSLPATLAVLVAVSTSAWAQKGQPQPERMVPILVHPRNADVVYARVPGTRRARVLVGGTAIAEVTFTTDAATAQIHVNIEGARVEVTVTHSGDASLAAVRDPSSSGPQVVLREVDVGTDKPEHHSPEMPPLEGDLGNELAEVPVVGRERLSFLAARSELSIIGGEEPSGLTEFEEEISKNPTLINGVVADPGTGQVIGYRRHATTGVTQFVDREGTEVILDEVGLETPLIDPLDLIPTPQFVGKVGVTIIARFGAKTAAQAGKTAVTKLPRWAISRMRGTAKALHGRLWRKALCEPVGFVRRMTQAGLNHSFDRHSVQWFGRRVPRDTHFAVAPPDREGLQEQQGLPVVDRSIPDDRAPGAHRGKVVCG